MAIKPTDREYVGIITAIIHAARLAAFSISGKAAESAPNVVDSAGMAVTIIVAVDRHLPPKERKQ